jgi:glutamyl-tRNA synthetase
VGNALNFMIIGLAARQAGGKIHLRIDDGDGERFRRDYGEDIFDSLKWLGLDWDSGPKSFDEYWNESQKMPGEEQNSAASLREAQRQSAYEKLIRAQRVYACRCSRADIKKALHAKESDQNFNRRFNSTLYPGTCREAGYPLDKRSTWRFAVNEGESVLITNLKGITTPLNLSQSIGDFMVRRNNGEAAYHLDSVLEDERLGITAIIRGAELWASTGAQILLAQTLGCEGFMQARFLHHGLIQEGGGKLSKSEGAPALMSWRRLGKTSASLWNWMAQQLKGEIRSPSTISAKAEIEPNFLKDLIPHFRPEPFMIEGWPLSDFSSDIISL